MRRTKVTFSRGFREGNALYGWSNGELYRLTPRVNKLKKSKSGSYRINKRLKSIKKLTEITVYIDFVHFDDERSMNAFRPALKKPEEGHGLKTGIPWKEMNAEQIKK